ncbi:MAG: hypothetical protein ACI4W2_09585 [Eubacterium sp.]
MSETHIWKGIFMLFRIQDKRKSAGEQGNITVLIDENFRRIYNGIVRAKENRALC